MELLKLVIVGDEPILLQGRLNKYKTISTAIQYMKGNCGRVDIVRKETADEDRYCCERRSVQGKP